MTNHPATDPLDVLIVGAGPTGLALAAHLRAFDVRFRLIDRQPDRVHESRALAIQPRTLEVLASLGITQHLVDHGQRTVQLRLHAGRRTTQLPLFDLGLDDTAYPYLLFVSQAETERLFGDHLTAHGVTVERRTDLITSHPVDTQTDAGPGTEPGTGEGVTCRLRLPDGRTQTLHTRYLVGCDGAHSTVRTQAGIPFAGGTYPQTFLLADLEADELEPGAAHTFLTDAGMLFFFPLGTPATWRMLAMRPPAGTNTGTDLSHPDPVDAGEVTLAQLQAITDTYTTRTLRLRLRDPVWMTQFRLHLRAAARYRAGPVFLAGDAAHVHSPAGAQGMNTGIQDAANLAWKLALTCQGSANPALLDTYQVERAPVGRRVLRMTDRAFHIATSTNPLARLARTQLAPRLAPLALRLPAARAAAFRILAQLSITYRHSPAATDGPTAPRRGPRAGDRLPDASVVDHDRPTTLHAATAAPGYHLLLCGPTSAWPAEATTALARQYAGLVAVHYLSRDTASDPGLAVLCDPDATALRRLGVDPAGRSAAHYLIRPDGHVGYRAGGTDLTGVRAYLARWLRPERIAGDHRTGC